MSGDDLLRDWPSPVADLLVERAVKRELEGNLATLKDILEIAARDSKRSWTLVASSSTKVSLRK